MELGRELMIEEDDGEAAASGSEEVRRESRLQVVLGRAKEVGGGWRGSTGTGLGGARFLFGCFGHEGEEAGTQGGARARERPGEDAAWAAAIHGAALGGREGDVRHGRCRGKGRSSSRASHRRQRGSCAPARRGALGRCCFLGVERRAGAEEGGGRGARWLDRRNWVAAENRREVVGWIGRGSRWGFGEWVAAARNGWMGQDP
nr:uncharacterized protein LOC120975945 [Aegilops tauschii subsp. strangulata]